MLKSFRKLVTNDSNLNSVQDNVFDTVTELQNTELVTETIFEDRTGVADNTEVNLGIVQIPESEVLVYVQAELKVTVSGAPNWASGYIALSNISDGVLLGSRFRVPLQQVSSSEWHGVFQKGDILNAKPTNLQVLGLIEVDGGTVTSRDILNVKLRTFRRSF